MKFTVFFALASLSALVGCVGSTVDPLGDAAGKSDQMVPIEWSYLMEAVVPGTVVICEMPSPGGPVPVPFPATWRVTEGWMSHLGTLSLHESTATFSSCVFGSYKGGPALIGELDATMVGANGDGLELDGVLNLTLSMVGGEPVPGPAYGEWDVVGGTGRFEGATGWIHTVEEADEAGSRGYGAGMFTPPGRLR